MVRYAVMRASAKAKGLPQTNGYNPKLVTAFYVEHGIPEPVYEFVFASPRRWRLDLAWPDSKLCMEVQGGIWVKGRHNRGAAMLKEWEKLNFLAELGWRVIYVQPRDLCLKDTADLIKRCLLISG